MPTLLKATSGIVSQLSTTPLDFRTATFWGLSGFNSAGLPVSNLSPVYIGINSGQLAITLGTGSFFNYDVRENLKNFWVTGAVTDGIYVTYYPQ